MRLRKYQALIVVGILCFVGPMLAVEVIRPDAPSRVPQIYDAEPLTLNRSEDIEALKYHSSTVILPLANVSAQSEMYDAPNRTQRAIVEAMHNRSKTVSNASVQSDLRQIARTNTFVHTASTVDGPYYAPLRITDADNGTRTNVSTHSISVQHVLDSLPNGSVVRYEALTRGEKRTVDRIIVNTTNGSGTDYYHPVAGSPFLQQLPALVYNNGTLYSIRAVGVVDSFGSPWIFPMLGLWLFGTVFVLFGIRIYIQHRLKAGNG